MADPTTAFYIVENPTTADCNTGAANPFVLVRLTDTSTTAPTTLPGTFRPQHVAVLFNSTGLLTGLVIDNAATGGLEFFAASGFPGFAGAPTTIASGVTFNGRLTIYTDRVGNVLTSGSVDFVDVTVGTQERVYRISATGSATAVYTTSGTIAGGSFGAGQAVYDNANVYFADLNSTQTTITLLKTPIATATVASSFYSFSPSPSDNWEIVDADGSNLIVHHSSFLNANSQDLLTLSVTGAPSQTPQSLFSVNATTVTGLDAFLDYGSGNLFVNTQSMAGAAGNPNPAPRSDVLAMKTCGRPCTPLSGAGGANTGFIQPTFEFGGAVTSSTKYVLEMTNLASSASVGLLQGGASLSTATAATPQTTTPVTQGGVAFVAPANTTGYLILPASTTVLEGFLFSPSGGGNSQGTALDLVASKIITIAPANESVQPAY